MCSYNWLFQLCERKERGGERERGGQRAVLIGPKHLGPSHAVAGQHVGSVT